MILFKIKFNDFYKLFDNCLSFNSLINLGRLYLCRTTKMLSIRNAAHDVIKNTALAPNHTENITGTKTQYHDNFVNNFRLTGNLYNFRYGIIFLNRNLSD